LGEIGKGKVKVYKIKINGEIKALKEVPLYKNENRALQIKRLKKEMEINDEIKHHKNILKYDYIIWFSEEKEVLGIVMTYIEGENLEKVINSGDLNWKEIFQILMNICYGIHYLHNEKSNLNFFKVNRNMS
jgi:serine/threonine protein kinase